MGLDSSFFAVRIYNYRPNTHIVLGKIKLFLAINYMLRDKYKISRLLTVSHEGPLHGGLCSGAGEANLHMFLICENSL